MTSRRRSSSTLPAARRRCISSSSSFVSAKKVITVSLRGSCPFRTASRRTSGGNSSPMSSSFDAGLPSDGSDPIYAATSGVTVATSNAPTMKKVKSAAFAKRAS